MKNKRLLSILIAGSLCLSLTLAGCGNKMENTAEITEISTEVTTATPTVENTTEGPTAVEPTSPSPSQGNRPPVNSDTTVNSNSSSNHKPGSNVSGGSVADAGPSDTAKKCTITVGSKGYVHNIGDTVTYTFYLTTPGKVEDLQALLSYDSRMLKLKSTESEELFPIMGSSVIYNTAIKDTVKFNAVNLSGYDFTQKGALITAEFEVLQNGGTGISTAIEIMSEKGGSSYFDSFTKTNSAVTCEEVLS